MEKRKVGRPKGSVKPPHPTRSPHNLRAFDDEWALVKRFAMLTRLKGTRKASKALVYFEDL